ncbi:MULTISPECIES: monovalent cation/H(+) antiporter subunit G [unclassified Thioalkalivibrio]|uniref:cation:proton antiporter n=1 Tax=unclassified Thioalkalivibrio TaxID=2621013 RepID=UPI00035E34F8|nr:MULTISPECIES: monovalent cation/H(+) antiporter subunit G [unclassified Thioalkalivibrio]
MIANTLTVILILAGLVFFAAGTAGLLRFPDVYSRLHALTKADNVGLGLVILGLMLQAAGPADILKLLLIWVLVLAAGTTAAHMVAQRTWTHGEFESDR